MVRQFNNLEIIHNNTKSVGDIFESKEKPDLLYIELKDEMINQIIERQLTRQEFEDLKKDVIEGIEAYAKLYAIKVKLDKLEKEL